MSTNLYGLGSNFHPENPHVMPALILKFREAKQRGDTEVMIWSAGKLRRDLLHVDDFGVACVYLMQNYSGEDFVSVGIDDDVTICELAELVKKVVGFEGRIVQDLSKPDGTPRKLMDLTRLSALDWRAKIERRQGVAETYRWFVKQYGAFRL